MRILVVGPVYGGSLEIAVYCASALKNLGHTVEYVDNNRFADALQYARDISGSNRGSYNRMIEHLSAYLSEAFLARCDAFNPDLVLVLAQAPLDERSLMKLKERGIASAFWFVEDFRFMDYWKKTAGWYDYFFAIQEGEFFEYLKKMGLENYHYLPMAAAPEVHRPIELGELERRSYGSDLSFVGAGYYNRRHFLKGLLDFDLKIWGTDWEMDSPLAASIQRSGSRVSTGEIVCIYNAANININLHSSTYHKEINPFGDFVNPRTFEIAACGGFQLVDRRSSLKSLFSEDEEIILFESLDEIRSKITYYLDHPDERAKIAQKGRDRVLRDHTYERRMEEMLEFIYSRGFEVPERKDTGDEISVLIQEAGEGTELAEYLSGFNDHGRLGLDEIVEKINSGEGEISKTETVFLIMNEFAK